MANYGFYIYASYAACFVPLALLVFVSWRQWQKARAALNALSAANGEVDAANG